jgi:hypothetical protein
MPRKLVDVGGGETCACAGPATADGPAKGAGVGHQATRTSEQPARPGADPPVETIRRLCRVLADLAHEP